MNKQPEDSSECSNIYPFKDDFIDLDKAEFLITDKIPTINFKTCSKYAHRFNNPLCDSCRINGKSFVIEVNNKKGTYKLNISKDKSLLKSIDLPVEDPLPEVREYSIWLLPYKENIILMMKDMYTTHYTICKYDIDGKLLAQIKIEHTYVTHPDPNTNYHHPYLYFSSVIGSQMIFSSGIHGEKAKTVVFSLDDFTNQAYEQAAVGLIPSEDETSLAGFVSNKDDLFSVKLFSGKSFDFEIEYGRPACTGLLSGNLLYIADYHPISTGSGLQCFDINTGKKLWTADVKQIMASHSEYYNTVTISKYKNKIILEGIESYGEYVQLFDAETGKRQAVFGDFFEGE